MLCPDLLQCYYRRLVQQVWAPCSKYLVESFKEYQLLEKLQLKENSLEILRCIKQMLTSKKQYSVMQMRTMVCLPAILVGSLLLSGCQTSQQFQFSAPSSPESSWSHSHHPSPKKPSPSFGDLLNSPRGAISQLLSQRDTFLLSQLPLWEQSSDSTLPLVGNKKNLVISNEVPK